MEEYIDFTEVFEYPAGYVFIEFWDSCENCRGLGEVLYRQEDFDCDHFAWHDGNRDGYTSNYPEPSEDLIGNYVPCKYCDGTGGDLADTLVPKNGWFEEEN